MRALCRECAELRRIARHYRVGRSLAEAAVVLAFVAGIGGASLAVVEPRPVPALTLVAEGPR